MAVAGQISAFTGLVALALGRGERVVCAERDFTSRFVAVGQPEMDTLIDVYNRMIDRRPALVVRPTSAADIRDAVAFARQQRLPLAVRCGGHSVAGVSMVEGGVQIDLPVSVSGRTGRAMVYTIWQASHLDQSYYFCSDVRFPGGPTEPTTPPTGAEVTKTAV